MIFWEPNPGPQTAFLVSNARELLYGGSAGGSKSEALVVKPIMRANHPLHRSLILRRTRPRLQELIDRQQVLYPLVDPGIQWNEKQSRWLWSSGAITEMGYAEYENDIYKFKSFEYDLVEFDELTEFTEKMYLFMFMRNRTKSPDLPPIIRSGTNPGGEGHAFVYDRFIKDKEPFQVYTTMTRVDAGGIQMDVPMTRQYIPSRIWDNPKLPNRAEYIAGLMEMGEDDANAYIHGVWTSFAGQMFKKAIPQVAPLPIERDSYVIRGMDYGWGDQTAVGWIRYHPSTRVAELVGRMIYINEATVDQIAFMIKQVEEQYGLKPRLSVSGHDTFNTQGTSATSIGNMMTARGVWFEKANNDRKGGWAKLNNFLGAGKLVCSGIYPDLHRTLGVLVRDPKNPQDIKKHSEDHPADLLRYLLMAVPEMPLPAEHRPEARLDPTQQDTLFPAMVRELQRGPEPVIFGDDSAWQGF